MSVAVGADAIAAFIPAASLHSKFASNEPTKVVITGAVWSFTVMVCVKFVLVFPHPSVKFHVRTLT